jgi:crossover junction endodeoxyribonuclease RuvC
MIIMGIDPGLAETGYGIIECSGGNGARLLVHGVISTSPTVDHGNRLKQIYDQVVRLIQEFRPGVLAVESIFHSRNLKSLVDVSEAIGVITFAAAEYNLPLEKFTLLKVKSSVVGIGKVPKEQVRLMIMNELALSDPPRPLHASDALAVVVCYRNLFL